MKTTAILVVAGLAAAASADVMTMSWTVSDTGNGDGIITAGEDALLTMYATMDVDHSGNGGGYAGSIFDILGVSNWDTGTVTSYINLVDSLGNGPGTLAGNGDITGVDSFQLPFDFNNSFDNANPIAIYSITWTPDNYNARTVNLTSANHANFSVYTNASGVSVEYTGDVQAGSFQVVPAPASLALLGLGSLAIGRRRR